MTEFVPFAPPPDAGPGAPGTVGDLYRIFGTDRKRDDAPAVAPATKLVVRKHDFSSAQTAYQRARSAPSSQLIFYKDATSRSGAQSTSRSSRSIADSRISRDRSPILRCGSAHTLLLSPCRRRRRVPNLLIM